MTKNQMLSNPMSTLPLVSSTGMMKQNYSGECYTATDQQQLNKTANNASINLNNNNNNNKQSLANGFQVEDPSIDPETINHLKLAFILHFCLKNKQRFKFPILRLQDLYKSVLNDPEGLAFADIVARLLRYRNSCSEVGLIDLESKIENVDSCLDAYLNQKRSATRQNMIKILNQESIKSLDLERRSFLLYDLILTLLDEIPDLSYSKQDNISASDTAQQWNDDVGSLIIKAGKDSSGCNYYYMDDLRLYREKMPASTAEQPDWSLAVGPTTAQWKSFITSLSAHSLSSEEADLRFFLQHELYDLVSQCIVNDTWPSDTHYNDELSCIAIKAKEFRELNELQGRISSPHSSANTPKSLKNQTSKETSVNNTLDGSGNIIQMAPILTPNSALTPSSNHSQSADASGEPTSANNNPSEMIDQSSIDSKLTKLNKNQDFSTTPKSFDPHYSNSSQLSETNTQGSVGPIHRFPQTSQSLPLQAQSTPYANTNQYNPVMKPSIIFTTQMANELANEHYNNNQIPVSVFHKMHPSVKEYMAQKNQYNTLNNNNAVKSSTPPTSHLTMEQIEKRRSKMAQLEKIHNTLNKQQMHTSPGNNNNNNQIAPGLLSKFGPAQSSHQTSPISQMPPLSKAMSFPNNQKMNDNNFSGVPGQGDMMNFGMRIPDQQINNGSQLYSSNKAIPSQHQPAGHQMLMKPNGYPPGPIIQRGQSSQIDMPAGSSYPQGPINPAMMPNDQQKMPPYFSQSGRPAQVDYFNSTTSMPGNQPYGQSAPMKGFINQIGPSGGPNPQMAPHGSGVNMYPNSNNIMYNDQMAPYNNGVMSNSSQRMNNLTMMPSGGQNSESNPAQREWDALLMEYNKGKGGQMAGMKRMPNMMMDNEGHMGGGPRQNNMMPPFPNNMPIPMNHPMSYNHQMPPAQQRYPMPNMGMMPQNNNGKTAQMPKQGASMNNEPSSMKKRKSSKSKTTKSQQLKLQQQNQKGPIQQMAPGGGPAGINPPPPPNIMMMKNQGISPNQGSIYSDSFSMNNQNNMMPQQSFHGQMNNNGPFPSNIGPPRNGLPVNQKNNNPGNIPFNGQPNSLSMNNMSQNITSASLASLQRLSQLSGPDQQPYNEPTSSSVPNYQIPQQQQQQHNVSPQFFNSQGHPQQQQSQSFNNTNVQITPKTPHTIQYMPAPQQPKSGPSNGPSGQPSNANFT